MDQPLVQNAPSFHLGSISKEIIDGPMRGWLCGHFYPKGSPFHRNDIEICIKELSPGISETAHHHLCSFEFLYVIYGSITYSIARNIVTLKSGMYYFLDPCTEEFIVNIEEKTQILCVRSPSIPNNKIFTDESNR